MIYTVTGRSGIHGYPDGYASRDGRLCSMHTTCNVPTMLASRLDREADAELSAGHVAAAERLAFRAAELRGMSA